VHVCMYGLYFVLLDLIVLTFDLMYMCTFVNDYI